MNRQTILFLLPILALLLIGGTYTFKWWRARTSVPRPTPTTLEEGINIEEEGKSLIENFGLSEENSVQLKASEGVSGVGVANLSDDRKELTIIASLPELTGENAGSKYQVWMQTESNQLEKIGEMRLEKGGYVLDVSNSQALPEFFSLVISLEKIDDETIEKEMMRGQISQSAVQGEVELK